MTTNDGEVSGTTKILDHGPAAARWNLVLLAEGYQQTELDQFAQDAEDFVETLLSTLPFDELREAINVYRIDVASTDSGADDPDTADCNGTGATPDTYFDATFCTGGLERLLTVNTGTVIGVADEAVPEWHVAMVIVNSSKYGGSGASGVPVFSLHPQANQVALHELGHSGFGLADEYPSRRGCGVSEPGHQEYQGPEPAEPNVTAEDDRDRIKWRGLILQATPVPTTENEDCTQCDTQSNPIADGTVGAFEGARYFRCGLYRPQFDCLMDELGEPFCAVCQQRIRETLSHFTTRREPMNYTVISRVRAHFGDDPDELPGAFWGQQGDMNFDCPGIDPRQDAVLMFQSLAVSWGNNVFTINDETVYGAIPTTIEDNEAWTANILLVGSGTLRPANNVLHVESRNESGGTSGNLDDFVIDNLVLLYKTG